MTRKNKGKEIVQLDGYIELSIDMVRQALEDDSNLADRAGKIIESHLRVIGASGWADMSTPVQQKAQNKSLEKFAEERKRKEKAEVKNKVNKAVAKALLKKRRS